MKIMSFLVRVVVTLIVIS
ncbi:conjugal transfer protein TrbE, partial [Salmonella enterica]|nr:conjugal transfer protein TrbE [Salmonella enterica]